MILARRRFLQIAAAAAAFPATSLIARAQSYPSKPVHLIVGFAAGGSTDMTARLMGQWLSDRLGQQFVIENRPGAGTTIGTEVVVRAPADGYKLLFVNSSNFVSAALYDKLSFNFVNDVRFVAGIMRAPFVMVVNPSFPAKTLPEFIAYAKANPGKVNFASSGVGTVPHMCGEMLKIMAGVDMVHVPYRGGSSALPDLFSGRVQVSFDPMPSSIEYIRSGKLRALAVTTATRFERLPDIPAVGEFLPGYEASSLNGIGAPRNTPAEVVDKLNTEINAILADAKNRARLADLGGTVLALSPTDFGKLIADETEKWAKVVRAANIKAE